MRDQPAVRGPELAVLLEEAVADEACREATEQQRVGERKRRAEVHGEVDRRRGMQRVEHWPRRRKPGVGENGDHAGVDRPPLEQAEPAADLAALGTAERRLAEAVLHREPLRERRRVVAREVAGREVAVAIGRRPVARRLRLDIGHRRVVALGAFPRLRVGAKRQRDQLAVLLESAAHGRKRAPGSLDRGTHPDGPIGRRAQEVGRHRAGAARRIVDSQLEAVHQDRHHVAAQRPAWRMPVRARSRRPRCRRRPRRG